MSTAVILTVVGSDRPGLTQAIAEAVAAVGGNWLESHLASLAGKYVGSVLVELPSERVSTLEGAVQQIDAEGLRVSLVQAGEESERHCCNAMSLEVVGQDRPGIVRELATALAGLNVNIEEFVSSLERSSWSGSPLFRVKARIVLPLERSSEQIRDALECISGEIMVDLSDGL
jgi:glycine cleavage system regulatory protein